VAVATEQKIVPVTPLANRIKNGGGVVGRTVAMAGGHALHVAHAPGELGGGGGDGGGTSATPVTSTPTPPPVPTQIELRQ